MRDPSSYMRPSMGELIANPLTIQQVSTAESRMQAE